MYANHFELDGPLFAPGIAQDESLLVGDPDAHADLMTHARIALSTPDAAIALTGLAGVGKTTLAGAALRAAAGSTRSAAVWLRTPPASPPELLESLLVELGLEPYKQSRAERLQAWRQLLIELAATETRVFVALERAHEAPVPVLQALDALTAPDPQGCAGANLILMGPDALRQTLDHPDLVGLRQRIRLVRAVDPLDAAGVAAYLRAAVERQHGTFEQVFAQDAVEALALGSGGIPRVLNHLTDSALSVAALRDEPTLTGARVLEVASDVYGFEPVRTEGSSEIAASDAADGDAGCGEGGNERVTGADGTPREDAVTASIDAPQPIDPAALDATTLGRTLDIDDAPGLDDAFGFDDAFRVDPMLAADDAFKPDRALEPEDALAETASVELDEEPAWADATGSGEPADAVSFAPGKADPSADAEEIPVLTDWIDDREAPPVHDDLDMLDAAETLTLLGEDVDAFAAAVAEDLVAADDDPDPRVPATKPSIAAR